MRHCLLVGLVACLGVPALSAEPPAAFSAKPAVVSAGGKVAVSFALSGRSDVEVAVLDAKGAVVRHLAAGVLGGKEAPPAPLKPGLAQSLEWDGKDDYGQQVSGVSVQVSGNADTRNLKPETSFQVRVRIGMGVKLDTIVGGDPYAYYSRDMGQGDHASWRLTGIEAKPDGTVYVLGNANNWGPPALRAFTAAGEYLRTVYPPPASLGKEQARGWGINEKPDGSYAFQYAELRSPVLSKTIMVGPGGRIARLIPSPAPDQLLLEYAGRLMQVGVDGSVRAEPHLATPLVTAPSIAQQGQEVLGPMQVALTPDRKHFFLAGAFAAAGGYWKRTGVDPTGPWRDGQVFKVDAATGAATPFFSLPEKEVIADFAARSASPIGDNKYGAFAALQGVAVDGQGRVFVGDRLHRRVIVFDAGGKLLRELPLDHADALAVSGKALYVTSRTGHFHRQGELQLHKFADWSTNTAPTATVKLGASGMYDVPTQLTVAGGKGGPLLWVGSPALPVRIYRDQGPGLEMVKDFYESGQQQRALDLQFMVADARTGDAYISDGMGLVFRVSDWKQPRFERCMIDEKTKLSAMAVAIDPQRRFLWGHADRKPVARYRMDGRFFVPAPEGSSHELTPNITNNWCIGLGIADRGIAASPDGGLATLGAFGTGPNYGGPLTWFKAEAGKAPWKGLPFPAFAARDETAGIRFDLRGNLYVGAKLGRVPPPPGFEKDTAYAATVGRIVRFAPTGAMGDLFPTAPTAPDKVYDVRYGVIEGQFTRTARFGVDGFGRIYYPSGLESRVSVIDNAGNAVLAFGTYGNRDSAGGLAGDLVPTRDVPLALPHSVDATDDHILVTDIMNIRLLRLAKTFAAAETVGIK